MNQSSNMTYLVDLYENLDSEFIIQNQTQTKSKKNMIQTQMTTTPAMLTTTNKVYGEVNTDAPVQLGMLAPLELSSVQIQLRKRIPNAPTHSVIPNIKETMNLTIYRDHSVSVAYFIWNILKAASPQINRQVRHINGKFFTLTQQSSRVDIQTAFAIWNRNSYVNA